MTYSDEQRQAFATMADLLSDCSRDIDIAERIERLHPDEVGMLLFVLATSAWTWLRVASRSDDAACLKIEAVRRMGEQ